MGRGALALAATLPSGLSHLYALAAALAAAPVVAGEQLRTWVTVPTRQLAISAATLGAISAPCRCDQCQHAALEVGVRVCVYLGPKHVDTVLVEAGATLRYGGVSIPAARATAYRLPKDFPQDRPATRLDEPMRVALAAAYGCPRDLAGHELLAASAHPVLLVGEPATARADLSALAARTAQPHVDAWTANGDIDQWYRRPVLTTGSTPTAERHPWLADVRPRLVITTRAADATAPTPWPHVPVLSLLSRRSPSVVTAADLAALTPGRPATGLPDALIRALRPGNGLEIIATLTPAAAAPAADDANPEDLW